MQLQQHEQELNSLDIQVVVVTFEQLGIAKNYRNEVGFPWPIVIDKNRELYNAYGMSRGSSWAIYGPQSWWGYIKLLLRGRKLHLPTDDVHQMGGDVLINPDGVVVLQHVGKTPIDRPEVTDLMDIVKNVTSQNSDQPAG